MKSKIITVITYHFPPEVIGTATRIYEIIRTIKQYFKNCKIFVLSPFPSRPYSHFPKIKRLYKVENINGILVFRAFTYQPSSVNPPYGHRILNFLTFPLTIFPIVLILMILSKIVIVVKPPTPTLLYALLAKFIRKKVIIDVTDLWHEEAIGLGYISRKSLLYRFSRFMEKLALKSSDIILTATESIRYYISCILSKRRKEKIYTLYTPINTQIFKPINVSKKLQIIYAGNLGKPQDIDKLILSMNEIKKKTPKIKLILVGDGECKPQLMELVKKLNLQDTVIFKEPVSRDKLPILYSSSLIGIVPLSFKKAIWYAVPTKIYEYMACGLSVVSYGSSRETELLIKIARAGIHVSSEDYNEISEAILKLVREKEVRERMSKNALSFIKRLQTSQHKIIKNIIGKLIK